MSNLSVEGLNRIIQSGETERMFSPTGIGAGNEVTSNKLQSSSQGVGAGGTKESGKNFSDILEESLEKTNLYQNQADTAVKELVAGRNKNIHETMLTIERADTSLKLMMQVRNKILDAYREIMRMQV